MLHIRIFPYSLSYIRLSLVRNKFLLTVLVCSALSNYSLETLRCYVNPPTVLLLLFHREAIGRYQLHPNHWNLFTVSARCGIQMATVKFTVVCFGQMRMKRSLWSLLPQIVPFASSTKFIFLLSPRLMILRRNMNPRCRSLIQRH